MQDSLLSHKGRTFGPFSYPFSPRETILYALGVGTGPEQQDFLHESAGPRVLPSFFATAAYADACDVVLAELGLGAFPLIHGDLEVTVGESLPAEGTLHNALRIERVHDAGASAAIDVECITEVDGCPVAQTRVGFFAVGAGGFGGNGARVLEPLDPPARPPDHEAALSTRKDQSFLYRLSFLQQMRAATDGSDPPPGDPHVDEAAARRAGFPRPVLHGVCTFGFLCAAAQAEIDRRHLGRVSRIVGRFTAPAYPGDTLLLKVWHESGRLICLLEGPDGRPVLSNAAVEYC